jgi:glycosyltransferase involved in cell wall biosynthesis
MQQITFVIPSRNNLEFLKLAYKSIRSLKTDHEILILDDASTDGTQEWIVSLEDKNLLTYYNPGPERVGIVGMFDRGIEIARTEIIFAFHADMIASPNLDSNILKHLKEETVVCATRVEPPLHPPGPEKITLPLGNEVSEIDYDTVIQTLHELELKNKDKTTEGIFAPWCMYKKDFLKIGGHDELFAPQSKEDSDLFNRFQLNGYSFVQSWDGLVYHFTSRGSRFNKHSGGNTGINSPEWIHTTTKNGRNFIRKWGHMVKHDQYMKPIIPNKYNLGFVVNNCTFDKLKFLEIFCDTIYTDLSIHEVERYIHEEQQNTKYDLKTRIRQLGDDYNNDIVVYINGDLIIDGGELTRIVQMIPYIIDANTGLDFGEYELLGGVRLQINRLNTYQDSLIVIDTK